MNIQRSSFLLIAILMIACTGCGQKVSVSEPESFAAPPDRSEQKGDTAPGPP